MDVDLDKLTAWKTRVETDTGKKDDFERMNRVVDNNFGKNARQLGYSAFQCGAVRPDRH